MRELLKILLRPLRFTLGIIIGICRFFCICSTAVLSVVASVLFLLSLTALIIGHTQAGYSGILGVVFMVLFIVINT